MSLRAYAGGVHPVRVAAFVFVLLVGVWTWPWRDAAGVSVAGGVVRVAPDGSDACTHGASSRPCQSFARAYVIAQPGDTVRVAAGNYPSQRVARGGRAKAGPAITFRCLAPHACTVSGLSLGQNDGSLAGDAPSFVTFDGIDVHGSISGIYNQNVDPQPTHLTFQNGHVWSITSAGTGMLLSSVDTLTLQDMEIGPICCGGGGVGDDGMEIGVNRPGAPSPSNVVLDRVYIHDLYDSCGHVPAAVLSQYGSCSGIGYGDGCASCDHVDGIQVYGAHGFVMQNSRIYAINPGFPVGQGLFMQEANGGSFSNVTLVNNMFANTPNNTVSMSGPGSGSWSGYLHVYYNTIQGNLRLYGSSGSQIFVPGTPIVIAGNIIGSLGSSNGSSCSLIISDGTSYTPVYSHNLNGNQKCGTTDLLGSPRFASSEAAAPDLRLDPGSRGIARGDVLFHPAKDIDGRVRPLRVPSDLGASQQETALIVPSRAIGAARLGMGAGAVGAQYGHPRASSSRGAGLIARTERYNARSGWLEVDYGSSGRVVRIVSTSRFYSTHRGVGPGAEVGPRTIRRMSCSKSALDSTLRGAALEVRVKMTGGIARVARVAVAAKGYGLCALLKRR